MWQEPGLLGEQRGFLLIGHIHRRYRTSLPLSQCNLNGTGRARSAYDHNAMITDISQSALTNERAVRTVGRTGDSLTPSFVY